MSTARAMISGLGNMARSERSAPAAAELEDILYDVLATGVAPSSVPGAVEAVQAFLHEHARKRKSPAELLAFFERYGLSTQERVAPGLSTSLPELGFSPAALPVSQPSGLAGGMVADARPARRMAYGLTAAAMVLLGCALGLGYAALRDVRDELTRVRADAALNAQTLSAVRDEAEGLRANLRDNAEVVRRVDQKSELLLQTFGSPLDPAQR